MSGIVKEMSKEMIEDLRATFSMFDTDGSGSITGDELLKVVRRFGQDPNRNEFGQIMGKIDSNNDGGVDFDEFLAIMATCKVGGEQECELKTAFDMIDTNNDGYISVLELKALLAKVNQLMTDDEIGVIMEQFDLNNDGELDFQEFQKLMAF